MQYRDLAYTKFIPKYFMFFDATIHEIHFKF